MQSSDADSSKSNATATTTTPTSKNATDRSMTTANRSDSVTASSRFDLDLHENGSMLGLSRLSKSPEEKETGLLIMFLGVY